MSSSNIEWTDFSWQVTSGCKMVSPGCANCYAETMANRITGMARKNLADGKNPGRKAPYLNVINNVSGRWLGNVITLPDSLADPLGWRKPRRVFVNSMSDLFHEDVPFEFIAAAYGVMDACECTWGKPGQYPRGHTFQVLTKRPERAIEFYAWVDEKSKGFKPFGPRWTPQASFCSHMARAKLDVKWVSYLALASGKWPLSNVWLGCSVEDQQRADERIPHLLKCPAQVRFLSVEPLLGPVNLNRVVIHEPKRQPAERRVLASQRSWCEANGIETLIETDGGRGPLKPLGDREPELDPLRGMFYNEMGIGFSIKNRLHWVIAGGESGPRSRPCNVEWIRSIVQQCKAAGVACFVKQLGANVESVEPGFGVDPIRVHLLDPKGGNPMEWVADLRVRQMPAAAGVTS